MDYNLIFFITIIFLNMRKHHGAVILLCAFLKSIPGETCHRKEVSRKSLVAGALRFCLSFWVTVHNRKTVPFQWLNILVRQSFNISDCTKQFERYLGIIHLRWASQDFSQGSLVLFLVNLLSFILSFDRCQTCREVRCLLLPIPTFYSLISHGYCMNKY